MLTRRASSIVLALLLGLTGPAWGAVAFDAAASGSGNTPSFSYNITLGASANAAIVGVVSTNDTPSTAVTVGGVSCTLARRETQTSQISSEIWSCVTSGTGTQSVAITTDHTGVSSGAISVSGADTTGLISNTAANQGSGTTSTVTVTSATGDLVIDCVGYRNAGSAVVDGGGDQTERYDLVSSQTAEGSTKSGASSVTTGWVADNSTPWAIVSVSVKASGGSVAATPLRSLMGVGQ